MSATYSETERRFVLDWRRLLGKTPADWTKTHMADGTSSFVLWQRLLARPDISYDLLVSCLTSFRSARDMPAYQDVVDLYNSRCGRRTTGRKKGSAERCEACDDTGLILVPHGRYRNRYGRTRRFVLTTPHAAVQDVVVCIAPCRCSMGMALNKRTYNYDAKTLDRAWKARQTSSGIRELQRQCAEIACRAFPDDGATEPAMAEAWSNAWNKFQRGGMDYEIATGRKDAEEPAF